MLRRLLPISAVALALAAPSVASATADQPFGRIAAPDAASPSHTLRKAEAVRAGRGSGAGRELTPLLKQLAVQMPRLGGSERARAQRLLARPTQGEASASEDAYTVPEHAQPFCSAHFCIHWVDTTVDAPKPGDSNGNGVPDYVETMSQVFEQVYSVENGQLGWRAPTSDGARGCPAGAADCMNKTDVYIKDLGGQSIYGYSAPDPGQNSNSQAAYLVMDNDYSSTQFPKYNGDDLPPMEVTAAHEYNHVLQFGYDTAQDTWMFESTAVWMEDRVYTDVNDYVQYIAPWTQLSALPLTTFNAQRSDDPLNVKVYGDTVWNRWLDSRLGPDVIRNAWERSLKTKPRSFAPGAYDSALRARGTTFFDAFSSFATDTAEWRTASSPFSEGSSFPDMQRVTDQQDGNTITLNPDRGGAAGSLDHTAYALIDVQPTSDSRIKLVVSTPHGAQMAIALVGRVGDPVSGTVTSAVKRLPQGGPATLVLDNPARFARITAVIANADGRTTGRFSRTLQDWEWVSDGEKIEAHVSTDFRAPSIRKRTPRPNETGVDRAGRVSVRFSEAMENVTTKTVLLVGPNHRSVKARIKLSRGKTLQITPSKRLNAGARYTVRLSNDIEDRGGNKLPASARTWSFRTAR